MVQRTKERGKNKEQQNDLLSFFFQTTSSSYPLVPSFQSNDLWSKSVIPLSLDMGETIAKLFHCHHYNNLQLFQLKGNQKSYRKKKPGSHFETPINFMGKPKQQDFSPTNFSIKNLKKTFMCKIGIYNYFFFSIDYSCMYYLSIIVLN